MPLAALIALLPQILDAGTQVAGLIQRLHTEGRNSTTPEESAALQAALSRASTADTEFDKAFGVNEPPPQL